MRPQRFPPPALCARWGGGIRTNVRLEECLPAGTTIEDFLSQAARDGVSAGALFPESDRALARSALAAVAPSMADWRALRRDDN